MSWDERIVERFAAVLRRRRGRKLEARGVDVAAARGRLSVLASVLAGRRLDVAIAEGPGGVCGDLLVLPPYVATFADADANVELLQARIVMGAVMARATAARGPHPAGQAAATFAAMCRARQAIAVELPGGDALIARCATALLAQRPAVESLSAVAQPLEAAAELALGADFDTLVAHAQAVDPAWLAAIGRGEALTAPARATVPPVVPLAG